MGWHAPGMAPLSPLVYHKPSPAPYSFPLTTTQGGERYQSAFYVFEEMAQTPASSGTANKSLVSQAIAELHLGRLPEAESALQQAVKQDPADVEAIANSIVLNVIMGKEKNAEELRRDLEDLAPEHLLLVDLKEKSEAFDQAAMKYSAKVTS